MPEYEPENELSEEEEWQQIQDGVKLRLRSMYPTTDSIHNRFYLYMEMAYEFVIGTQIISKYFLDICEVPVSDFFNEF